MLITRLQFLLGLLLISLVLFLVASIFRKKNFYKVSGTIEDCDFGDNKRISYGVVFVAPPKLDWKPTKGVLKEVIEENVTHCTLNVRKGIFAEGRLQWSATGALLASSDPRTPWEKFDGWQKAFGITTIFSALSVGADLLGIWQFFFSKGQ